MKQPAQDQSDVTLTLRGERIPLQDAVSSVYNRSQQKLLVATPTTLYLYGKMLTAGGELLATLAAEENVYYQFVDHLCWLDSYSVIVTTASGTIEHRIVSSDLKTSPTSHTLMEKDGELYTALTNSHRRELITADTEGGIKVWALRVTTAVHNNSGFKGVLRVHTAANSIKRPYYRHLRISFDGQRIFAATTSKVYVFDAASCNRLQCCLSEDRRPIFSMECGKGDSSVYLVFKDNMRKICKYSFVMKKGLPQFRRTESPTTSGNEIMLVDICASFTIAHLVEARYVGANELDQRKSVLTLPFSPPSEQYNALHTDTTLDGRNVLFAVWSTGFCIMEVFLASSQGRILCNSFNGDRLKRLQDKEETGMLSISQQRPSQVVMFTEKSPQFNFASLPTEITNSDTTEKGVGSTIPIIEYLVADDAIVVLWSHGLVKKHNLADNRSFVIVQPFNSAATTACTMISLCIDGQDCVAIGDSTGAIGMYTLLNCDSDSYTPITRKQAFTSDRVSVLIDVTSSNSLSMELGFSLLSVSQSGDVKLWFINRFSTLQADKAEQDIVWNLLACFRTYSSELSTATFEFPDFLFCGFDSGSVECWRFPKVSNFQQQSTHRISVVKRALHAIDLHLSPVRSIICEAGAGTLVTSSPQPLTDNFSWVFSYDEDAIILVWCFSLDFFFPQRRIKVHNFIKGIYISPANGYLDLFAYINRCIDRVDHLGDDDKQAVMLRLRQGRELSAQRELNIDENGSNDQVTPARRRHEYTRTSLTPSGFTHRFTASSVRINITLPAMEEKFNLVRKIPAGISPVKAVAEEPKPIQFLSKDKHLELQDAPDERSNLRAVLSSSPTRMQDRPPTKPRPQSPLSNRSTSRLSTQRNERSKTKPRTRSSVRDAKTSYLPGQNSLPSSFQQTKPRIYRKAVNPVDSLSSQARCAVITAGNASSRPSSSEDERNLELLHSDAVLVRPTTAITLELGIQEKVAVVSLVEDEDESILLLDFRPGTRRSRARKSRHEIDEESLESTKASYKIPFLPWERMSEHDRRIELMAATKSKSIQEEAEKDKMFVPPVEDFESTEVSVQSGVRSFTRWFAASHRHHQRIRERFLMEELFFAAIDPLVHQKLADVGLSPAPSEQIGIVTNTTWQEFVSWYCLGLTSRSQTIPPEVLQRERLKARTEYLEMRLQMVTQSEFEVREEEERAGTFDGEYDPPQRVFIFEHFIKRLLSEKDNPTSWENISLENQQKEITLALLDPAVQIAAMRNDIELPDVSGSCLEDFDILKIAGRFVPWWKATRNIHRREFLQREVHEASTNKTILELLSKESQTGDKFIDKNDIMKDFFQMYFKSDSVRHTFLKKKLFYLRRKSRIASVARYGKLPSPFVVETLPVLLVSSFQFVNSEIIQVIELEELSEFVEEEEPPEASEMVELEETDAVSIDNQCEQDEEEDELRRLEEQSAKSTLELVEMTREDALSYEFNTSFVESDDDIQETSLTVPKRTDFSRSYFFGNLPTNYRKVSSSGWRAGSGVDNGDEEHEEEEQLERERERQRLLDEQEAERLLELERQAERARIEKEREEKAFQFRRVRQAELRKVLIHQAEMEAQRKADIEMARERNERAQMQREDERSCWLRNQLARDQNGMLCEDQLALQIRQELHEYTVAKMRLLLHEQTCMATEDQLALQVCKEQHEFNRQRAVRTAFLSELYTPYHPFYPDSATASESFLPRLQWRLQQEEQRRTPVKTIGKYTIPLEDELLLDDLDQDPYLARDSRKFKLLMGLPLRTSSSQKRPRIPTANAIIAMQQRQRLDYDDERQDLSIGSRKYAPVPHKLTSLSSLKEQNHLPDIVLKPHSVSSLTDLKKVCRKQDTDASAKRKKVKNNQQQQNQQNQSLPFFRGNMVVKGQSQARLKDYSY